MGAQEATIAPLGSGIITWWLQQNDHLAGRENTTIFWGDRYESDASALFHIVSDLMHCKVSHVSALILQCCLLKAYSITYTYNDTSHCTLERLEIFQCKAFQRTTREHEGWGELLKKGMGKQSFFFNDLHVIILKNILHTGKFFCSLKDARWKTLAIDISVYLENRNTPGCLKPDIKSLWGNWGVEPSTFSIFPEIAKKDIYPAVTDGKGGDVFVIWETVHWEMQWPHSFFMAYWKVTVLDRNKVILVLPEEGKK